MSSLRTTQTTSQPLPLNAFRQRVMRGAAPLRPVAVGLSESRATVLAQDITVSGSAVQQSAGSHAADLLRGAQDSEASSKVLLRRGRLMDAAAISLLASMNIGAVPVIPPPVVAIMSISDSWAEPGVQQDSSGRPDANSYLLEAQVHEANALAVRYDILRANYQSLMVAFSKAVEHVDVIIVSASPSAYPTVTSVLQTMGHFNTYDVALDPGNVQRFGHVGPIPVFGFPDNTLAVGIGFEVCVRPLLRTMQGLSLQQGARRRQEANSHTGTRSPAGGTFRQSPKGVYRQKVTAQLGCDVLVSPRATSFVPVRLQATPHGVTAVPVGRYALGEQLMLDGGAAADSAPLHQSAPLHAGLTPTHRGQTGPSPIALDLTDVGLLAHADGLAEFAPTAQQPTGRFRTMTTSPSGTVTMGTMTSVHLLHRSEL